MKRIPQLDGLRGCAILGVLIAHYAGSLIPSGSLPLDALKKVCLSCGHGVDLFFILSGFLIGGILLDQRQSPNLLSVFYARRTLRIVPVYFASLAVLGLLQAFRSDALWDAMFARQLPAWVYLTFTQNILFAIRGWDVHALTPSWSLAVEEQFYLVLPALVLCIQPRKLPLVLVLLIGLAPLLRTAIVLFFPTYQFATYMLLPCRWEPLLLGVLVAWAVRAEFTDQTLRTNLWLLYASAGVAASLWAMLVFAQPQSSPLNATLGLTAIGIFCLCVFLLALYDPRVGRLFDVSPLRWLGSVSYGVYLFHQGVVGLLFCVLKGQNASAGNLEDAGITLLALLTTLGLAALSYRFFELPLVQLGHGWKYAVPSSSTEPNGVLQFTIRESDRGMIAFGHEEAVVGG